ncbi:GNAT family protein [Nocardioides sp. SOB77]|uniref:GNAT family protein n=1 Tax=Nocardioides oceani TaxID=3058369 RepID=A0ABT8FDK4_9ACTN|nr:GNAT family protein [Nocardioides oceani]MDN4172753.1 GNAT family protein [Nocardioides oceani]
MPHVDEHGQAVGDEVPGWTPRTPPAPVVLEGRYVRLEPVAATHAAPLFDALGGAEDAPLWTYRPAAQPADVAAMARDVVTPLASHTGSLTFAIVPTQGPGPEEAAGLATYWRVEPDHGVIEISGVLFARRLQRTRAATEAMHLMIGHAVEEWGYRRVEWKCDALNEPSRRAALRLGFTYEGRFRQHMVTKGRTRDTDWFSIVDGEWPGIRAAHQRWLDPANFDEAGQQRSPLEVGPRSQG